MWRFVHVPGKCATLFNAQLCPECSEARLSWTSSQRCWPLRILSFQWKEKKEGREGGKNLPSVLAIPLSSFQHQVKNTYTIARWWRFEYGETLQILTEIPVMCYWLKMTTDIAQGEQGYYLNKKKCKIFFKSSSIHFTRFWFSCLFYFR